MTMSEKGFAIYSSRIFTGLPEQPWVEAVACVNGRIAAIGSNEEVRKEHPLALAMELPGCLVAPGFVDAHCHFANLGKSLKMVDLRNLSSLAECRSKIREAAAKLQPGQWLIGRNWNHTLWCDNREPQKADLDDLVPDNPAVMTRCCGHSHWVNSRMLDIMHITPESPDPPGGQYDKDSSGEPTGILREAHKIIKKYVPESTHEEMKEAILAAQEMALKFGITGIHTCESITEWKAFADLDAEGLLKIRIHHLFQPENIEEMEVHGLRPGHGSERLWVGHLKLFADGSLGAGTALLCEDYSDEPGCQGLPFLTRTELEEKVRTGYQHGFDIAIHAIGDLAGKNALDALESAREDYPGSRRDRIEHVQLHRIEDLNRFREMDVTASVQPVFVATDLDVATRRWGVERCSRAYAWKTLIDNGIRMQFGSDSPVEPINPMCSLQAAVLRQNRELYPKGGWFPEQRLTLEQALAGFSSTAAWVSHRENRLGTLKPGNYADLTVFDKDLSAIPPEEWMKIETRMTVINGEIVYQK